MSANLALLAVIGGLVSCGVYLLLERSITRMLLGWILVGNGANLLIVTMAGGDGNPAIVGRTSAGHDAMADPLAQAMVLTAIVITMGVSAFVLALGYRSFRLFTQDRVEDDPEDLKVASRRSPADEPDYDRTDDPETGEPTLLGDAFDAQGNPIPIEELENLEDIECYDELHTGESRAVEAGEER